MKKLFGVDGENLHAMQSKETFGQAVVEFLGALTLSLAVGLFLLWIY